MDALLEQTFRRRTAAFLVSRLQTVRRAADRAGHSRTDARRGCSTRAAAPARNLPLLEKYGTAVRTRAVLARPAIRARTRSSPAHARQRHRICPLPVASVDVVVSFDVLYCLHPDAEQAAIQEMFRVLRPAARHRERRRADMLTGDHSALGGEVHRYTRGAAGEARATRVSRQRASPTRMRRCFRLTASGAERCSGCAGSKAAAERTRGLLRAARAGQRALRRRARGRNRASSRPGSTCRSAVRCCAWRRKPLI